VRNLSQSLLLIHPGLSSLSRTTTAVVVGAAVVKAFSFKLGLSKAGLFECRRPLFGRQGIVSSPERCLLTVLDTRHGCFRIFTHGYLLLEKVFTIFWVIY